MPAEKQEIAVALLAESGFEAFEETHTGLDAYIQEPDFDQDSFIGVLEIVYEGKVPVYEKEVIPPKDWNEEWERNFEAIGVDDVVQVLAPFKTPDPKYKIHLIIQPKMSFGTGHHETTRLMIRQMVLEDFNGKSVLDMGCGSGILSVLAARLGASEVVGIDIDQWSFENSVENMELNGVQDIQFLQGDVSVIPGECYEIILANINRNVLLEDLPAYRSHLSEGGLLVLSGFMLEDERMIRDHYEAAGFRPTRRLAEGDWLSMAFILDKQ